MGVHVSRRAGRCTRLYGPAALATPASADSRSLLHAPTSGLHPRAPCAGCHRSRHRYFLDPPRTLVPRFPTAPASPPPKHDADAILQSSHPNHWRRPLPHSRPNHSALPATKEPSLPSVSAFPPRGATTFNAPTVNVKAQPTSPAARASLTANVITYGTHSRLAFARTSPRASRPLFADYAAIIGGLPFRSIRAASGADSVTSTVYPRYQKTAHAARADGLVGMKKAAVLARHVHTARVPSASRLCDEELPPTKTGHR